MSRHTIILVLTMAVIGLPTAAGAIEPGFLRQRILNGPPHYPPTENRYAHVPPGHERFYAQPVPAYPWLDRGLNVPTYNWGYFGARTRPNVVEQHGYYDDYRQWSFRPGQ